MKIFYYEQQIKRELQKIHTCGCRCYERLKAKTDGSTRLGYTGLHGELEHRNIETRLIGESLFYYEQQIKRELRCVDVFVYFHQNKKRRGSGKGKCHDKTMMSTKAKERLK